MYRDNCFEGIDVKSLRVLMEHSPEALDSVISLCDDVDYFTPDAYYSIWISDWREVYRALSLEIQIVRCDVADMEQDEKSKLLKALAKLANTMINARQYLLDKRRGIKDREAEVAGLGFVKVNRKEKEIQDLYDKVLNDPLGYANILQAYYSNSLFVR